MINRILICYRESPSVKEKAIKILDLIDELKDELNNPLWREGLRGLTVKDL